MRRACFAALFAVAGFLLANPARLEAQNQVAIDGDDIGGVVTGPHGPEAGVWVIAETRDLPTHYAKMVVTDDQGRYVVPDLPKAKYQVWVRGYGLIDSPKTDAAPGQQLNLTAVPAPNDAAAAQYYPAIYWFAMLKIPDKDQFGGKSDIPAAITQTDWLTTMKNQSCVGCHQLGQLATRTIPAALGEFKSGEEAWIRRVQSGQASPLMANPLAGKLGGAPFKYFGDWTDGIARGDLNAVGLGNDVPISTANENDGFAALVDGKMMTLRVPYPLGFYAKGLDARIDDPQAGWKGRGLWSSEGDRTPWLKEGGKGMPPLAVHIQVRPDPLAH